MAIACLFYFSLAIGMLKIFSYQSDKNQCICLVATFCKTCMICDWCYKKKAYIKKEQKKAHINFFCLLNPDISCFVNSVDPDKLAAHESHCFPPIRFI